MNGPRHAARRTSLLTRLRAALSAQPRRKLVWVGMPGYQIPAWFTPSAPAGQQWENAEHDLIRDVAGATRHGRHAEVTL